MDGVDVFDLDSESISVLTNSNGLTVQIPQITGVNLRFACAVALPETNSIFITGGNQVALAPLPSIK